MRILIRAMVPTLFLITVLACAASSKQSAAGNTRFLSGPTLMGNHYVGTVEEGLGMSCSFDGKVGPLSYPVTAVGKHGVPPLEPEDARMLAALMKYVHPTTLRFTYLGKEFVVFDSSPDSLCDGRPQIDLTGSCNEYYEPLNLYDATAANSCINPPRPWIKDDKGAATATWSWSSLNDH